MVKVKLTGVSFASIWRMYAKGTPVPTPEYKFHPTRRWRFDFAWPDHKLAVEIEGGTFKRGGGRHNRGLGHHADCDKYNAAAIAGWMVLRYTSKHLKDNPGKVIAEIKNSLEKIESRAI